MLPHFLVIAPWVLIIVSLVSLLGNGTILITVIRNPFLRQTDCLYLIAALAVADCIAAAGTIPYCLNMIINDYDNCTVGSVLGTGMVHIGGLCMNQVITLFLGLDRIYALFWPFKYRLKNQATIARSVAAFGIFMGCINVSFLIGRDLETVLPTCNLMAAMKVTPAFLIYRLIVTFFVTVATQVVYIIVYWKLHRMVGAEDSAAAKTRFQSANAMILFLLVTSLLFMTVPSICNLIDFLTVKGVFLVYGPAISIVNIINGAVNVFIYSWAHRDFNRAIKSLFHYRSSSVASPSTILMVKHTIPS